MKKISAVFMSVMCFLLMVQTGCEPNEEEVEVRADAGGSFLDIENDGYVVTLNAQAPEKGMKGTWRVYNGDNYTFENPNDPNSKFYGEPGEIYEIGWEISTGEDYKVATINVSYKPLHPVILTNVGDTTFNNISVYLEAEAPKFGATGVWEIVEGEGGRIENAESHQASFIGLPETAYKVSWTLNYGSKSETKEFEFVTDELVADAGEDEINIKTADGPTEGDKFHTLNAFLPAGATATWSVYSGEEGEVFNIEDAHSIFKGTAGTVYSLVWDVTLDEYNSTDTLKLRFRDKWGIYVDPRDEQEYRYVQVDTLEWMADNFNYTPDATWNALYGRTWYYGMSAKADIVDGHAVETEEDRKYYGRLYNWYAAMELAPEGWRLPTRAEYEALQLANGGSDYAFDALAEGGVQATEFNFAGGLSFVDENVDGRDVFSAQNMSGYYWTADYFDYDFTAMFMEFRESGKIITLGRTRTFFPGFSVRYVRVVQKN